MTLAMPSLFGRLVICRLIVAAINTSTKYEDYTFTVTHSKERNDYHPDHSTKLPSKIRTYETLNKMQIRDGHVIY